MTPAFQDSTLTVWGGNALEVLKTLPDESHQTCVTSPPYWALRSYLPKEHPLKADEIGLEATPEEYVSKMVEVFREVRRVLRNDGTCWINIGDCYATGAGKVATAPGGGPRGDRHKEHWNGYRGGRNGSEGKHGYIGEANQMTAPNRMPLAGLKPKDLVGVPWMLAFALRADGWYLRSEIIWQKPSCMPESVTDRPTKSHEQIFLLTKCPNYFYDAEAIMEPCSEGTHARLSQNVQAQIGSTRANGGAKTNGNMKAVARKSWKGSAFHDGKNAQVHPNVGKNRVKDNMSMDSALAIMPEFRNKRTVWTVPAVGYSEAHFATFPPDLIKPCILAGSKPGDTVLDPFGGSGTTGAVAIELGRKATLIELNPEYLPLIEKRTHVTPGLPL